MLALDIGGTKIAAATVVDGVCIDRRQLPMPASEPEFLAAIKRLASGRGTTTRAAVALTGYTDGTSVRGVNRTTIPFWQDYPLMPRLRELLGCPVAALNDAQAAAWGEYLQRPDTHCRDLLFLTLSTGVGGGLVLDGRLRIGPRGLAGHFGHMAVEVPPLDAGEASARCGCGRLGCLEAVASGTALARQSRVLFGEALDAARLFELAAQGEPRANTLLDHAAAAVASAIASSQLQLDLQTVVVGGSVGLAAGMVARIRAALERQPALCAAEVVPARLGGDAGLVGVAAWAATQEVQP
nr:ROK family protein [uncultured Roseateles sp.]